MAHPKRRQSHARTRLRRANDSITLPKLIKNPETGEFELLHRVNASGKYRGKQVVTVKVKTKKQD